MFAIILGILAVSLWLLCVIHRAINIPPQRIFSSALNNTRASSRDRSSPRAGSASSPSSTGSPSHAALYHKLHNLEDFSEILPTAYQALLSLLYEGLLIERQQNTTRSILGLERYNRTALEAFLHAEQQEIYHQWEDYNERRASGQSPELFNDKESAKKWLKRNAPLKLVDGSWLGHVHKITTPFALRTVTKNAWQVLSEELGDGDLEKNHVYLYRMLLQGIGVDLPASYTADFIQPGHGMDDEGVWKAATAQLLISLFPNQFLPEILGFNLHYELVTLDTLKASKELPEFGISGYYFALHVSIDNADSGHTAMALATVDQYMTLVAHTHSADPHETWKRIQAGYVLSATVGNHAALQPAEERVINIIQRKASASHRIHCTSKLRIGKQSLAEWLAPQPRGTEEGPSWGRNLLTALADARPWVYRGDSRKSLLMREL